MEPPPPAAAVPKIRFLCSHGGHIIPRPHSTSLTYSGGDTKLLSLSLSSLSLSSLSHHLSRAFHQTRQFLIKYQLPGEDLDSLISVTSDEDLTNMIDEHSTLPALSRIRLFLFPARSESLGSGLRDPKTESWFCDALKGVNLIRRGVSADSGLLGGDVAGVKSSESVVLETNSSFGSTGSTVSMTNLPSIGAGEEIGGAERRLPKLPSSASLESDNTTPIATLHQPTTTYQDSSCHLTSSEATTQPTLIESPNTFPNPTPSFQIPITSQAGPHQAPNQIQHQQEFPYMQTSPHYMPQYSATPNYYPMYYQQNQPYPVYYVPVRPTQAYNIPTQYNLVDTPATKEIVSASTTPLIQVDLDKNQHQQQLVDLSEVDSTTQSGVNSDFDDDFAYTQIYKTQPSGPGLISQYQTMMNTADNIKI